MRATMLNSDNKSPTRNDPIPLVSIFLAVFILFSACPLSFASEASLQNQMDQLKNREDNLFLNPLEIHEKFLSDFVSRYSRPSEVQKMIYLAQILRASQRVFIRNGNKFSGRKASEGMLWKMKRQVMRGESHSTAEEFISHVATYSKSSGLPYEMLLDSGATIPLGQILRNELASLESVLAARERSEKVIQPSLLPVNPPAESASSMPHSVPSPSKTTQTTVR